MPAGYTIFQNALTLATGATNDGAGHCLYKTTIIPHYNRNYTLLLLLSNQVYLLYIESIPETLFNQTTYLPLIHSHIVMHITVQYNIISHVVGTRLTGFCLQ